jgi:GNAT superfamily N-acetyltransferase
MKPIERDFAAGMMADARDRREEKEALREREGMAEPVFIKQGTIFVIDLPKARIATVSVRPMPCNVLWLFGLRVAEEFRHQGYAAALMRAAMRYADSLGAFIHLMPETECRMTNAQLAKWYGKLGFEPIADGSIYEPGYSVLSRKPRPVQSEQGSNS